MAPDRSPKDAVSSAAPPRTVFVLDVFDDGLVVMPLDEARRLAALNDALEVSSTWGEFLRLTVGDSGTMGYVQEQYEDLPNEADAFDADELPGFSDGYWPTSPKEAMLDWLPQSVAQLGTIMPSAFAGRYLRIDEHRRHEAIQALAAEGIECREDTEDLVVRACGQWRYS
jgi:hypothetical protein